MTARETRQRELWGEDLGRNNPHIARTIMLSELTKLFDSVPNTDAPPRDYLQAMLDENCLQKRSESNRRITARRLTELYIFNPQVALFRALKFFWWRDIPSRPLLALLAAYARDSVLRDSAKNILALPLGSVISRKDMEEWVDTLEPGRFSSVTLSSVAKNLNSSWTQSGHLSGRVNKIRDAAAPSAGAVAFALFLSYMGGVRGAELFKTEFVRILDCPESVAAGLAQEASQRGWIKFTRIAEIKEAQFPQFLNEQQAGLLNE